VVLEKRVREPLSHREELHRDLPALVKDDVVQERVGACTDHHLVDPSAKKFTTPNAAERIVCLEHTRLVLIVFFGKVEIPLKMDQVGHDRAGPLEMVESSQPEQLLARPKLFGFQDCRLRERALCVDLCEDLHRRCLVQKGVQAGQDKQARDTVLNCQTIQNANNQAT